MYSIFLLALETNNFNDAIENHIALIVDHSNLCAAWGAALRQIILTVQQQDNSIQNSLLYDAQQINNPINNNSNILIPGTITNFNTNVNPITATINNRMNEETTIESTNNIQHI